MKWENSMMAYEEDIEERGFLDWLKAHTSFMKPLHRYAGTLELTDEKLKFTGKDDKEGGDFSLEVDTGNIISSHYGFDDVFSWWEDRAFPWNKPLRVRYRSNDEEETIYLFANFHHKYYGLRTSDNKEVDEEIKSLL